jgi:arsenate reductase (thioredoxin)
MSDDRPFRVLVLCTGNSARSQIAEALLVTRGRARSVGAVEAESAGSRPAARVNPYAIETLATHGIAWDGRAPTSIDDVAGRPFDLVITVCDHAREACPVFAGARAHVHWGLPDPADVIDPVAARRAFADTFLALEWRVDALLALPLESLDVAALRAGAQHVHDSRSVAQSRGGSPHTSTGKATVVRREMTAVTAS